VRVNGGLAIYRPRPRFIGTDSFTFRVSDGQLSDIATVEVAVERRRAVTSTLTLSNANGGKDRAKVTITPAVRTTVRVFRVNKSGGPVEVGSTKSSSQGGARLTIVDAKLSQPTTYFARVAATDSTSKSSTGRSRIK
jgi:hypothetical protein